MKALPTIFGAAWLLTVAAAYMLGASRAPDGNPAPAGTGASAPSKSQRDPVTAGAAPSVAAPSSSGGRGVEIVTSRPPRQAVAELARLGDPMARASGFVALAESLADDEFRDVVDDFRSLGITRERMSEYAILLHAWGEADPEGALDYALENTGTNFARNTILASWAGYDPDAALAFANGRGKDGEANALLIGVIRGIAPDDIARATTILGTMPRSEERGEALEAILPLVLKDGVDAALAWSDTIGEAVLRQGAASFIARSVADEDPRQAADIVLSLPDREFQVRAIDDIAETWAESSVDEAITWAEGLAPDLRAEAAQGIVDELASDDPARAAEWMLSLAETTDLDPAVRSFVRTTAYRDPDIAAAWNREISDDRERERNYHRILGHWMNTDAPAARTWIGDHAGEVPESIRRRFGQSGEAEAAPR